MGCGLNKQRYYDALRGEREGLYGVVTMVLVFVYLVKLVLNRLYLVKLVFVEYIGCYHCKLVAKLLCPPYQSIDIEGAYTSTLIKKTRRI